MKERAYDCCVAAAVCWLRLSGSREQEVKRKRKEKNMDSKSGKREGWCTFAFCLALAVGKAVVRFGIDARRGSEERQRTNC
jgi:hypothetical protein